MPALTREALQGGDAVRRRTAGTMALVAAPAAMGLALVAGGVVVLLFGAGYADGARAAAASSATALLPLFMNALLSWALAGAGPGRLAAAPDRGCASRPRCAWPSSSSRGSGRWAPPLGLVGAEWLLLALGVARLPQRGASTSGSLGRSAGRSSPACRWRWP